MVIMSINKNNKKSDKFVRNLLLERAKDFGISLDPKNVEDVYDIYEILDYYNSQYIQYSGEGVYDKELGDIMDYMESLEEKNYLKMHPELKKA